MASNERLSLSESVESLEKREENSQLYELTSYALKYLSKNPPKKGCLSASFNDLTRGNRFTEAFESLEQGKYVSVANCIVLDLDYHVEQSPRVPPENRASYERRVVFLSSLTVLLRMKVLEEVTEHRLFGEMLKASEDRLSDKMFSILHPRASWQIAASMSLWYEMGRVCQEAELIVVGEDARFLTGQKKEKNRYEFLAILNQLKESYLPLHE